MKHAIHKHWLIILLFLVIIGAFLVDYHDIIIMIPNCRVFAKNIKFINMIIEDYKWICIAVIAVFVWHYLRNKTHFRVPKIKIAGMEIELDNTEDVVKNNVKNYLATKRSLFAIDIEHDNFDDVMSSYHGTYCFIREQMSYFEDISQTDSFTYKKLMEIILTLNRFLTKNQSDYRRWYKFENEKSFIPLKQLQPQYYAYDKLIADFKAVNFEMCRYAKDLDLDISRWS